MALRITWRDDKTEMQPANGRYFTSAEVRAAIGGGSPENVYLRGNGVMIVDGDGHAKELPLNVSAGALYGQIDAIAGNVLVMSRQEWEAYDRG